VSGGDWANRRLIAIKAKKRMAARAGNWMSPPKRAAHLHFRINYDTAFTAFGTASNLHVGRQCEFPHAAAQRVRTLKRRVHRAMLGHTGALGVPRRYTLRP
jgi:hypothetical protein